MNNNPFRGCSFDIVLRNDMTRLSWSATELSLPSIDIGESETRCGGIKFNQPGDSLKYGDIDIEINVSDDLREWFEAYDYITQIKEDMSLDRYRFEATIIVNNNNNIKLLSLELSDVVFNRMGELRLSTKQSEVVVMPITLSFSKIEPKKPTP